MAFTRYCRPSRFAILCLSGFTLVLLFMILDTVRECNDEELLATKSLLQKYSHQVQELKSKNSNLRLRLEKTESELRNKSNDANQHFVPGLPIIYLITPTHTRLEQKAELTRMSYTLKHVKNVYWIVIEDSQYKTELVAKFLKHCGLPYAHLNILTPQAYKLGTTDPNWLKPRGVLQRNQGLKWLRNQDFPPDHSGVLYFADDDNTYSLQLFDEMRFTKKVSVWPVGLVGNLRYERPIVQSKKVVGWYTYWKATRPFALDMAGFAVNLQLVLDNPEAVFSNHVQRGYQESTFLNGAKVTLEDLEPKANLCTEILVWHTRTMQSNVANEAKMMKKFGHGSDLSIEV